jgi:Putative Flp pilus-assembly TadE/G-like
MTTNAVTNSERGAAAILVAISMLVLVGFAALAIDGGLGFDQRRGTQNAADNAALAAAWEACNPRDAAAPDPVGSALAVAAQNGYDDNDLEVVVTVNALDATEYEVIIQRVNDTTFAGPGVGAESLTVVSQGVATCEQEQFLGGYAIFAGADVCASGGAVELDLSGSTKTVNGGIFSNGDLKITGSDANITGSIEYRGNLNTNESDVVANAEKYFGSPKDYPVDLDIAEFRPGGPRATGDYFNSAPGVSIDNGWMVSHGHATGNNASIVISQSGIYYSPKTGNKAIDLKGVTTAPGVTVTFVAEGQIEMNGSANITGHSPVATGGTAPLLMFSNAGSPPACNVNAIQYSGNGINWTGLMYAPRGEVQMSSSSNVAVFGSIIAYTVNVSGSDFSINWQNDSGGTPRFTVEMQS